MNRKEFEDELLPEYDLAKLSGGVRGKYVEQYNQGTNLVLLAPDIARSLLEKAIAFEEEEVETRSHLVKKYSMNS